MTSDQADELWGIVAGLASIPDFSAVTNRIKARQRRRAVAAFGAGVLVGVIARYYR